MGQFSEKVPATTVAAGEVPTPPGPLFSIASPRTPETKRASAPRHVTPKAPTPLPRLHPQPEGADPKASASCSTESVVLADSTGHGGDGVFASFYGLAVDVRLEFF